MKTLNYIKHIPILLLTMFLFQRCSLDEDPKTFISPDAFFTNYDSYESAVLGVYHNVPNLFNSDCMMILEMFSDIYDEPNASYEQALPTYQNDMRPIYYNTRRFWQYAYATIKNANFVISKMPEGSEYIPLQAEAKFLRAYAYFYLVQIYGDVPLRKVPVESYKDTQIPRSPQQEVYDFIVEDLTYAETNLYESAPQEGRVYKKAATALLAKVYLTMAGNPLNKTEYYAMARDKAASVINSGSFKLMEDYASVFHNIVYSGESIWEQLYNPQTGGNSITGITMTAKGFKPILLPAEWFMNSFTAGDRRGEWGISKNYTDASGDVLAPLFSEICRQFIYRQ